MAQFCASRIEGNLQEILDGLRRKIQEISTLQKEIENFSVEALSRTPKVLIFDWQKSTKFIYILPLHLRDWVDPNER